MDNFDHPVLTSRDLGLAALVLRAMLGVNFLLHGLTRLPDLPGFARGMAAEFEGTWMPTPLAEATGYVIPLVETGLGVMLLLGLLMRPTLLATGGLMVVLHFGVGLQQAWGTLGTQLVYGLAIFLLLCSHRHDPLTLDRALRRRPARSSREEEAPRDASFSRNGARSVSG